MKPLRHYKTEELEHVDDKTICSMLREVAERVGENRMPTQTEIRLHLGRPMMNHIAKTGGSARWSQKSHLPFRVLSLCWQCANAVPTSDGKFGCEWSVHGLPVEGWVLNVVPDEDGINVKTCPEFIAEKDADFSDVDYDTNGIRNLGIEVVRLACTDYRDGIEKWLRLKMRSVTRHTLYRNRYKHLYGKTASKDKLKALWYQHGKNRAFLSSAYADSLSDFNCIYLRDEIEKMVLQKARWRGENPFEG